MRKLINMLFLSAAAFGFYACTSEVDDIFDKSPAERVSEAIKADKDILTSASNGWVMNYYSDLENKNAGGTIYLLKFDNNDNVTVASVDNSALIQDIKNGDVAWSGDLPDVTQTTHYKVTQSAGIVLSLDEYNDIFHTYSDPGNSSGAWVGDFEFRIISASKDKIELKGKKTEMNITMEPIPEGKSWDSYLDELVAAFYNLSFASYKYETADGRTLDVSASDNYLTFKYEDELGTAKTLGVPYIVKPDGYYLYEPTELFGATVTKFAYDGDATYKSKTFSGDDGKSKLTALVLPLNQALLAGSYYVTYDNLSPLLQRYWDYAIPRLKDKEGEQLMYVYFNDATLWFRSGSYWGGFDVAPTLTGENQVTYTLTNWAGTDSQKSNASYYWNVKDKDGVQFFPYFISPLLGTFTLRTKIVANPTIITLTSVDNPNIWFKVQSSAAYATNAN